MCTHTASCLCCNLLLLPSTMSRHRAPDWKRTDVRRGRRRPFVRKSSGPWGFRPAGLLSHPGLAQRRGEWPSGGEQSVRGSVRWVSQERCKRRDGFCSGRSSCAGCPSGLDGRLTSTESQWLRLCGSHGYRSRTAVGPLCCLSHRGAGDGRAVTSN